MVKQKGKISPYTSMEISDRWLDPKFKFFINREGSIKGREKY